ncbi:MAG: hypothetical protein WEB06_03440 [Actinomycetota bacterium]
MKKSVPTAIADRVGHLIATVQQAQVVAAAADEIPDVAIPTPEPLVTEAATDATEAPDSGSTP